MGLSERSPEHLEVPQGAVRAYDVATAAWALVFGARYLVQSELYDADQTGWLAAARIGMGWPLTGLVLLS